jgi:hypothetical protein
MMPLVFHTKNPSAGNLLISCIKIALRFYENTWYFVSFLIKNESNPLISKVIGRIIFPQHTLVNQKKKHIYIEMSQGNSLCNYLKQ